MLFGCMLVCLCVIVGVHVCVVYVYVWHMVVRRQCREVYKGCAVCSMACTKRTSSGNGRLSDRHC